MNQKLNVLSKMQKFEAPSCNSFQDIMITNFQSPNLQREIIKKQKTFFEFSPVNLLCILNQMTKFEASNYNSILDIMITNFQSPNLQWEIIKKK